MGISDLAIVNFYLLEGHVVSKNSVYEIPIIAGLDETFVTLQILTTSLFMFSFRWLRS